MMKLNQEVKDNMKRRETIKPNELKSGQNKIEFNKKKCC